MPIEIEPSSFPSITSISKRTKYVHKLLQYRILNESELELDLLKSIDLRIPNKSILELAYGRRALIDQEQEILKFPRNPEAQSIGSAGQKKRSLRLLASLQGVLSLPRMVSKHRNKKLPCRY